MKILKPVRMDRCIGCHSCALACARLVHKNFSWYLSGITIRTSGGLSTGYEASVCQACEPAACVAACPTKACTQRPGGGVKKNADLCIRCGKCADACPVEAVHMDRESGYPYVCIHCGRCVPFCPHNCLEMGEPGRASSTEDNEDNALRPPAGASGGEPLGDRAAPPAGNAPQPQERAKEAGHAS